MSACKNCNNEVQSTDKFCSNCGQKNIERLSVKTLLDELANAFFAWDSKLFNSLRQLLSKPGILAKNYIRGERKKHVAPLRMYLFISIVFFAILSFLGNSAGKDGKGMVDFNITGDTNAVSNDSLYLMVKNGRLDELQAVKEMEDGLSRVMMKKIVTISVNNNGNVSSFFIKNISIMYFFFIPVFGWLLKLFYRKNKLDYIEHLVYGLYFHSFMFLTLLVAFVTTRITGHGWPFILAVLILVVYFIQGMKTFYEAKTGIVVLKGLLLSIIYSALFVGFAVLTLFLTIWFY